MEKHFVQTGRIHLESREMVEASLTELIGHKPPTHVTRISQMSVVNITYCYFCIPLGFERSHLELFIV